MAFFSFNGVTKDYVRVLRGLERPAWAPIEHEILEIPGRPGGLISSKKIKVRQINIPVRIYTKGFESLQKAKEDLAAWLITDEPKELIFSDEPDRVYYAQVTGELNLDEIVEWGEGVISFLCPDPYKYGPLRTQTIAVPPASFSRNSIAYLSDGTQVSANQPRFEQGGILIEEGTVNLLGTNGILDTDTNGDGIADGWSAYATGSATGTRSMDSVNATFGRSKCQRIERTGGATTDRWGILLNPLSGATNPNTVSVLLKIESLDQGAKVVIYADYADSANNFIQSRSINLTAVQNWSWITLPKSDNASVAKVKINVWIEGGKGVVYVQAVQSENKPYATSFANGTRQPETLTLPTDGVLNPLSGTIEFWAYVDAQVRETSRIRRFFSHFNGPGNANRITIQHNNSPYWVFTIGDNAGNAHSLSPADSLTPDGWHHFAMVWDSSRFAVFIDGVKRGEILNPTYLPQSIASTFDIGHSSASYQPNTHIGPFRISRIARSDAEILEAYQNGFTVDEYTTAYLPFDGSLEVQTPNIVVNEGTAETYPTFTAYVKQPITFLDIISPDSYMRVGQPYEVSQTPVDGDKPVMQDKMTTTTGWGAATSVVDGIVQGTMVSDGERFVVQSYGPTYNGWAGPALKKSLPYPIEDFRMYSLVQIHANEKGTGRVEIYGLDTTNNIVFRATIADFWQNTRMVRLQCELGTSRDMAWMTYGKKKGDLNYYYGAINIRRKGNLWEFYTARVNNEGNLVDFVRHTFTDTKNKYTAPLAQLQVHIGCHMSYGPVDHLSINHLYVYELRDHQENQVPYIAYPDDVLQFDHKNAVIYRNGEPIMAYKDFGARFFPLAPGATELAVNPSDAAVVTIDYRPRYK